MVTHEKKNYVLFSYWLTTALILVFFIIIIGGLTRLTNSGLSITQWELFKGILPPLALSKWEEYFDLYKEIPQFKILYPQMSLSEFKIIFYWEYFHRILGRVIGLFFLIPLIYFHYKKIDKKYLKSCNTVMLLILLQGFVGWYMVMSGLVNELTVSHYRLSLHLGIAILIISIIFWQILSLKEDKIKVFFYTSKERLPYLFLIFLIFIQIIFGAFVSGLDAGKIYQNWPLMGINYFPDDVTINNFLNLVDFENHSLIQFYHRNLAYLITVYILILSYLIFKKQNTKLYKPIILLIIILSFQVFLGIFTLLSNLHIALASMHQIISVILILSALNLYYYTIK